LFILGCIAIYAIFALALPPYFSLIEPDSIGYLGLYADRTAVYPRSLLAIGLDPQQITYVQLLLFALASVPLLLALLRASIPRSLIVLFVVLLGANGYFSSFHRTIMTESLFFSVMVVGIALAIDYLRGGRVEFLADSGLCTGLLIAIRPAGPVAHAPDRRLAEMAPAQCERPRLRRRADRSSGDRTCRRMAGLPRRPWRRAAVDCAPYAVRQGRDAGAAGHRVLRAACAGARGARQGAACGLCAGTCVSCRGSILDRVAGADRRLRVGGSLRADAKRARGLVGAHGRNRISSAQRARQAGDPRQPLAAGIVTLGLSVALLVFLCRPDLGERHQFLLLAGYFAATAQVHTLLISFVNVSTPRFLMAVYPQILLAGMFLVMVLRPAPKTMPPFKV
jgi:hypothetical protein